ncbi:MAG: PHP domain-containing protein [Anaerolineae bacterium]|nr:PHP domain-containing protein [Anaerolineae bacterium]
MVKWTGRADLHMHTNVSDGVHSVQQVLDYVSQQTRLDVIAITDHDRLDASLWAYERRANYPFDIVPGVEVTSADGHVLALWVTQPVPKGLSLAETAAAIHEQDGIAVLAHPLEPTIAPHNFLRYLTQPSVLIQANIDAVEVMNAGAFTPGCNWLAQRAYRNIGLPVVGNSDAHMIASIGSGFTWFAGRTAADLRMALALGQTAAEGTPWPITTYLRLLHISIQQRRSAFLATRSTYVPQTRP